MKKKDRDRLERALEQIVQDKSTSKQRPVKLPEWKKPLFVAGNDWLIHQKALMDVFLKNPGLSEDQKAQFVLESLSQDIRPNAGTVKVTDFTKPVPMVTCAKIFARMQNWYPTAGSSGQGYDSFRSRIDTISQKLGENIQTYTSRIQEVLNQFFERCVIFEYGPKGKRSQLQSFVRSRQRCPSKSLSRGI